MSKNDYPPVELREMVLQKFHDVAHDWATRPDLSPLERCHGTVFGVLSVIDGVDGNGPDGQGLPMFQLLPSPHPQYNEARAKQGLPTVNNGYPLDYKEDANGFYEGSAQLRREYAVRYDQLKDDLSRSAASLFS